MRGVGTAQRPLKRKDGGYVGEVRPLNHPVYSRHENRE